MKGWFIMETKITLLSKVKYNRTLKDAFFGILGNAVTKKNYNPYRDIKAWLKLLNDEDAHILYDALRENLDLIENLENKSKLIEYLSQIQTEDIGL